ncbi:MAG TPA: hypothetical protein VLJ38_21140, partial [Polyangiaceae bacterium]|nr:hypothetical protein [Polyangiaceae bacterium]
APPVEGWRELFDALDNAKQERALAGETYAAMLRSLLERIASAEHRVRELERVGLAAPITVSVEAARAPSAVVARELDEEDSSDDARSAGEARLFREIHARYQRLVGERQRDAPGLLADVEERLAELPDLDPGELADAAADLGALALLLGRRAHSG